MQKNCSNNKLTDLCEFVLQYAKKSGATAAEVSSTIEDGFTLTVRNEKVDALEYHLDKNMSICVYFGKKSATVNSADFSQSELINIIDKACVMAKFTQDDPCNKLADKELLAKNIPNLDLAHKWDVTLQDITASAIECEKIAKNYDKRIVNSEGVIVSSSAQESAYANSNDFCAVVPSTMHSISCEMIAQDKKNNMERDYSYTVAINPKYLLDFENLAITAAQNSIARLGAKKIKTQKLPVIFSSRVARSLIGNFIAAISGSNLYRKSTFLYDKMGEKIFAENLNIFERPYMLQGIGSSAFDDDGVATTNKNFITDGVLTSYVLDYYSACKLNTKTTGNAGGVYNLFATASNSMAFAQMLGEMNTGIVVTELIGQGVNLITGDYSRGACGFYVKNGVIQYPVSEITIAGNLEDMFKNIVTIGDDVDYNGNIQTGSIFVNEMMVAGQ